MQKFNLEDQSQHRKETHSAIKLLRVMVLARLLQARAGENTKYTICEEIQPELYVIFKIIKFILFIYENQEKLLNF